MNAFTAVVLALAVAGSSASHLGLGHLNHAAHIPSGSVSVGHNGAVIAGPAGSVRTDNGLHGHGAGAQISGPAGDVGTQGGHARLTGPGAEHGLGHAVAVAPIAVAPIAHVAPAVIAAPIAHGHAASWGHSAVIAGPAHSWGHAGIVAAPAHSWGHAGIIAPVASWGHGAVLSHGLVGHGHHGW